MNVISRAINEKIQELGKEIETLKTLSGIGGQVDASLDCKDHITYCFINPEYRKIILYFTNVSRDWLDEHVFLPIRKTFGCDFRLKLYPEHQDINYCVQLPEDTTLVITSHNPIECKLIGTGKMKEIMKFDCSENGE